MQRRVAPVRHLARVQRAVLLAGPQQHLRALVLVAGHRVHQCRHRVLVARVEDVARVLRGVLHSETQSREQQQQQQQQQRQTRKKENNVEFTM